MSQTILLKRSSVAGKVPTTAQLDTGEIAVNTVDGKLYLRGDNGVPFVKELGGDPFPSSAGKDGMFLKTDGVAPYWSDTGGTATRAGQTAHGFVVGEVVRFDGTAYAKASAAAETTADVIGVVTDVIDANNFEVTTSGIVEFPVSVTFTPGAPYFLSPTIPGAFTTTEPTDPGTVSKPLFIALSAHSGLFYNWRGIENTAQVEIDQMLPAQAGNAGKVLMTDGVSSGWQPPGVGFIGYTGSAGVATTGYTGSAGVGYTGSSGTNGYTGSAGAQGPAGADGAAANQGLGYGQTWQVVTRTNGTPYTNTTGKPIMVNAIGPGGNFTGASIAVQIGGVYTTIAQDNSGSSGYDSTVSAIIPDQTNYMLNGAATVFELR